MLHDSAIEILADRGASGLTTAGLARRVNLADASIFRHFASMEAVVDAAIDRFEVTLNASITWDDPDPQIRLRHFFVTRLAAIQETPALLKLAFNGSLEEAAGPAGAERVRAVVRTSVEFLRAHVEILQASGSARRDVEPEFLVWTMMGVLRGVVHENRGRDPEQVWNELERIIGD